MEQERRRAPRTPFHLGIEVWGRNESPNITDLSTNGVFISSEKASQYKPGDEIDLVLKFPTEEEGRGKGTGINIQLTHSSRHENGDALWGGISHYQR